MKKREPQWIEPPESRLLNAGLDYASKIESVEPELAAMIRKKAWEEFRERVYFFGGRPEAFGSVAIAAGPSTGSTDSRNREKNRPLTGTSRR